MKNKFGKWLLLVLVGMTVVIQVLGGGKAKAEMVNPSQLEVVKITTDKATYRPSSGLAQVSILLKNTSNTSFSGDVTGKVMLYWAGSPVEATTTRISFEELSLGAGQVSEVQTVNIPLPSEDIKGYLIQAVLEDSLGGSFKGTGALDVTTDLLKFPRYGAQTYYGTDDATSKKILTELKDAHLNMILNYDWFDGNNPQNPYPIGKDTWYDSLGHPVSKARILSQNAAMTGYGMIPMAYNMANAVVTDESAGYHAYGWYYGVQNPNKIVKDGIDYTSMGLKNDGDLGSPVAGGAGGDKQWFQIYKQIYMNMGNGAWQNMIYKNMNTAISALKFKGWQMDNNGLWGNHYSVYANGRPYGSSFSQAINFGPFASNYRKTNPEAVIGMNTEGQGMGQSYRSQTSLLNASSFAYAELWDGGDRALSNDGTNSGSLNGTYDALKENVDATRKLTSANGSYGKSLVIANYQQKGNLNPQNGINTVNESAELLSNAVVGASGGSRLNLVNGSNVIYSEYYADSLYEQASVGGKTAATGEDLKKREQSYQNFMVAYENLLRDGQDYNQNPIKAKFSTRFDLLSDKQSQAVQSNHIQAFAKSTRNSWADGMDTINLINWSQVQGDEPGSDAKRWGESYLDGNGNLIMNSHKKPSKQKDLVLTYYSDKSFTSAFVTSPDDDYQGQPVPLTQEGKYYMKEVPSDISGKRAYEIKIPSLDYWNLIVLKP